MKKCQSCCTVVPLALNYKRVVRVAMGIERTTYLEVTNMRTIGIDLKGKKEARGKMEQFCIGAGRANLLLRKALLEQLETAHKECGFKYVRFHGIFHEDMGVYREVEGKPIYNWLYVDQVYDSILAMGMKPFVEVGFMPYDLAAADTTVFWWKGNVTMPKSDQRWYDLVYHFTKHLQERYGNEEVRTWYFEIWNEPNYPAFFCEVMEEYFKLYALAARAIKAVNPYFHVGGPATGENGWIKEFIDYCIIQEVPIDFVSTHTYGVEGTSDAFGKMQLSLKEERDSIINDVKGTRKEVLTSLKPDLELYYTQWSSSYSCRDAIHDSYIQAPYILHTLKNVKHYVNAMSYWALSDIFEELGTVPSEFHGGFGLMTFNGYKKPAYYVYQFLNDLFESEIIVEDEDCIITHQGGSLKILLWDFTLPEDEANQSYFSKAIMPSKCETVIIPMENMENGIYHIKTRKIGYKKNDIFSRYLEDEKVIRRVQFEDESHSQVFIVEDHQGILDVKLEENEVLWLEIKR